MKSGVLWHDNGRQVQAGRQTGPMWKANPMYTDASTDLEASAVLDERQPASRPSGRQTPSPSAPGRNPLFQGDSDSLQFKTVHEPLEDTPSPERLSEQNSGLQTPLWQPISSSKGAMPCVQTCVS